MGKKTVVPFIESAYHTFTPMEKVIGDFFIHNTERGNLAAKTVAERLFVSEASLSRFAKKCGYKGYREFLFYYLDSFEEQKTEEKANGTTKHVLETYQELLSRTYAVVDESQVGRFLDLLLAKKRIYIYGKGSSGLAGEEMQFRFMRIGVNVQAITDSHLMKMHSVLVSEECLVIGISVSGQTEEVIHSLKAAKAQGARVVLMTSRRDRSFDAFCDEVLLFAVKEHMENGRAISPQFPILIMVDILYSHYMQSDRFRKEALHELTMDALQNTGKGKEDREILEAGADKKERKRGREEAETWER